MRKKYLLIPAFAVVALLGGSVVFAKGGFGGLGFGGMGKMDPATMGQRFDDHMSEQANVLGISASEMKGYWAQGRNISEIAREKGITQEQLMEKMKAARDAQMKEMLQTLVSQGKITQTQADVRLKFMQDKMKKMGGKKGRMGMMGGMHGGMMQK